MDKYSMYIFIVYIHIPNFCQALIYAVRSLQWIFISTKTHLASSSSVVSHAHDTVNVRGFVRDINSRPGLRGYSSATLNILIWSAKRVRIIKRQENLTEMGATL